MKNHLVQIWGQRQIGADSELLIVSAYFTIYAYGTPSQVLEKANQTRFQVDDLDGAARGLRDPG